MRHTFTRPGIACVVLLMASLTLSGCYTERHCGENDYPVKPAQGEQGSACVPQGSPPPSGWTTYPPGQTPTP